MHTARVPEGISPRVWLHLLYEVWDRVIDSHPTLDSMWILNVRGGIAIYDPEGHLGSPEGRALLRAGVWQVCDPAIRQDVLRVMLGPDGSN